MRLSTLLSVSILIFCCTGSAKRACRVLRVRAGTVAACAVLTAFISGVRLELTQSLAVGPASLLLLIACCVLASGERGDSWELLLVAFLSGTLGWLFTALFPAFYEPGLLVAASSAVVSRLFLGSARRGLLCASLAPLVYGAVAAVSDWYLFDAAQFALGNGVQLDAQLAGAFLLALFYTVPAKRRAERAVGR